MPAPPPKKWSRLPKGFLRRCRFAVLLVALLLVAMVLYLSEIGLPDFLKRALVDSLHSRGIELQFTRLRLHWYRGLVAENVRFGTAMGETNGPQLSIKEVELKLNHAALARFAVKIDSLLLRGGQLAWTLAETNQPTATLAMTNIATQVRFLPNDQWELDHFTAGFAGAKLQLSGSLTNATALRDWKIFHGHGEPQPGLLRQRLRELARTIDRLKFDRPPELSIVVRGDARDPQTFNGLITLAAPHAKTPWGTLANGSLLVRLIAPNLTNDLSRVECHLHADDVVTHWAEAKQLQLDLHAASDESVTNLVRARLDVSAIHIVTPWAQTTNAQFSARWTHSLTNPIPIAGGSDLRLSGTHSRWGDVGEVRLHTSLSTPPDVPARVDAGWGWWAGLAPYFLNWNCQLENIRADDFISRTLVCGGNWRAPELTVTNLHTEMYQGHVQASAKLNVATRLAGFAALSDFDIQKAVPFLTPGGRRWFLEQKFEWENPPLLHVSGSVILPEWTNRQPNWRGEVLPTLLLQGDFKVDRASYRSLPVNSARSHLSYSNETWSLPDLVAIRPEGNVELSMLADDRNRSYYFNIHSAVDIKILRDAIAERARKGFDEFTFEKPPLIDAEIWGYWRDYDRIGARARVTVSNFTFRGESATYFHGAMTYTNRLVVLTEGRVERTNEFMTASALVLDFSSMKGYLTNGYSTMSAEPVVKAIGKKVARTMEPYHFMVPPVVHADGVIPLSDDISVADLHFRIDGQKFEWLKFHVPQLSGRADWTGEHLTLSDMKARFYGGKMTGSAAFDFRRNEGSDFTFDTTVTGASLHSLMADLKTGTNQLEGTFNGYLKITRANSEDLKSWFGKGQIDLKDGFIWEIPIFGIFSPVLDTISPGLGKSRASQAAGTFVITNSVIHSEDLEIYSPPVRLQYRGTVDFNMKVDALVEAEIGRSTPLVGSLVSAFFSPIGKLFEERVSGTLADPKREPAMFVPRLLSPLFHPWRTLKEMLPGDSSPTNSSPPASSTNSPPH